MPLKDKYLKYTPEITLEIFTLVCNKLIENGINPSLGESIATKYNNFSETENYLQLNGNRTCFECYKEDYGLIETTVQKILGYDPFVKEFVLPEKWCIKNSTDKKLLKFFENYNHGGYNGSSQQILHYPRISGNCLYPSIQNGYTEITFDQFKTYVLKEPIEKDWLKVSEEELLQEAKRRYPIGCKINSIKGNGKNLTVIKDNFTIHNTGCKIGITVSTDYANGTIVKNGCSIFVDNKWAEIISLPETKVESKSIEKWSVGSYVVFCKYGNHSKPIGFIDKIIGSIKSDGCIACQLYNSLSTGRETKGEIKWFATLQEAEEFAKTLIEPVKEEYPLTKDESIEKEVKLNVNKWYCCKSEYNWYFKYIQGSTERPQAYEWIDLDKRKYKKYTNLTHLTNPNNMREVSLEEIQQYLPDGHPDLIKTNQEFKVGDWVITDGYSFNYDGKPLKITQIKLDRYVYFENSNHSTDNFGLHHIRRHATPEEINQHLISIGQIPAGEPLNCGIKPDKDGMFKYTNVNRGSNPLCEFTSITINGEEIYNKNKFNILKTTKTIKF